MSNWVVHKFGGTSLANGERYREVAKILTLTLDESKQNQCVIVSAMSGVTNSLLSLIEKAVIHDKSFEEDLKYLTQKHIQVIQELLENSTKLEAILQSDAKDISDLLRAIWLTRSSTKEISELLSGFGEIWSARILSSYLSEKGDDFRFLDARNVLEIAKKNNAVIVDWESSKAHLQSVFKKEFTNNNAPKKIIATGFIARKPTGVPTTLGRDGSDYSASIFGSLLDANTITIWTDVDGVMSANPRQVPEARFLEELSYDEAMELSYFGAKVVHPNTMAPALKKNIPIIIRNSFNPTCKGTRIHGGPTSKNVYDVRGFATIEGMALINVEGSNMLGVPGIAQRLFGSLRDAEVSVVLISQGSSEHSICFAIPDEQAVRAKNAIEETFFAERHHGYLQQIDIQNNCAILAAVGDNMAGTPGIAARFFDGLAKARINVRAIAQGASERNISVVIDAHDSTRALRSVHAGFYLSKQTFSVGLIGTGVVGSVLLQQLAKQRLHLRRAFDIDIRMRGIITSSKMLLHDLGLEYDSSFDMALGNEQDADLTSFAEHIQTENIPHSVLIDCTSSEEVASHYAEWLTKGIHIITPNKKANSGSKQVYENLRQITKERGTHYLYETTVGAGLPILQSARELIQTGDTLLSFEGVFSGTLSYLFNAYDTTTSFSTLVKEARDLGYTEPDPRDDLRGIDVARKVVILGREFGLNISLEDVSVESLVPPELDNLALDSFLERLHEIDTLMVDRFTKSKEQEKVLRYVGRVSEEGKASVRLESYPSTHAFARIQKTDNIVQFRSARYSENPLIVQGPGAGPEVTAGGVFADILRLASNLGARR